MGVGAIFETNCNARDAVTTPAISTGVLKVHLWAPAFIGFGGGIAAFSRELATALCEREQDVRLFGKMDLPGLLGTSRLWGTRHYTPVSRNHVFAAGCLASAVRHRPDRIVSTHVNFGPVAHVASRLIGVKFTLVAHGIDIHPALPRPALVALRAADSIIAVSSWTRLRVLDLGGIDPANVTVLANTVDEDRFNVAPVPESLARRYGIRPGEKILVMVARLASDERYKGYDRVIQSLPALQKECGPVRFVLVGEGEDRERVECLARDLGIERAVTFAGFVPDAELADHYRMADAFAMPSTGEGFGIVFLEAMGCGTPVVAGNRDGSVDALQGGRLGKLVDPNDIQSIVSGIASVLKKDGPSFWYDRHSLRKEMINQFGRAAFRNALRTALPTVS